MSKLSYALDMMSSRLLEPTESWGRSISEWRRTRSPRAFSWDCRPLPLQTTEKGHRRSRRLTCSRTRSRPHGQAIRNIHRPTADATVSQAETNRPLIDFFFASSCGRIYYLRFILTRLNVALTGLRPRCRRFNVSSLDLDGKSPTSEAIFKKCLKNIRWRENQEITTGDALFPLATINGFRF